MFLLNKNLMRAVSELRTRRDFIIPCTVLVDGVATDGLIGPEMAHNQVQVLLAGVRRAVALGQVGVNAETLAKLEGVCAELDAEEAEYQERLVQARMWSRNGARRNPITGHYNGHHCEKAGR